MPLDDPSAGPSSEEDRDGFLAHPRAVALMALALAVAPPPPVDLRAWAVDEMVFPKGDAQSGPYRADKYPMWDRLFEVLSLDHPATDVALRGSAQIGKTTILNIFIAGTMASQRVDILKVDPTAGAVQEWKATKFDRLRRTVKGVRDIFGAPRKNDSGDSTARVETLDGFANLRLVSAQSPAELSATSRPVVILDDLSKFENSALGDPERLAIMRARAFANPKVFRASVPGIKGACRISAAVEFGTNESLHVPCPHCDHMHPLVWENLEPNLREGELSSAYFTCPSCSGRIENHHRAAMVSRAEWVAANPTARNPSFSIWSVYFDLGQGWGAIVDKWFAVKGDPVAERTFYNDELGRPYDAATSGPKWEFLRDRAEAEDDGVLKTDRGRVPPAHPILAMGIDCQDDRVEWAVYAYGRMGRRHCVNYGVEPVAITDRNSWVVLDRLLERRHLSASGQELPINMLAIDGGAFTTDVWEWAVRWPANRVKVVKGTGSSTAPLFAKMRMEGRKDARARRARLRGYVLNVGLFKSGLYADLEKDDPLGQGYCGFATGLSDLFYRGLVSEHVVKKRGKNGVMEHVWDLIDPKIRNEPLDCTVYSDFAARVCGWRTLNDHDWQALEAIADAPHETQDLFTVGATPPPPQVKIGSAPDVPVQPAEKPKAPRRKMRRSGFV